MRHFEPINNEKFMEASRRAQELEEYLKVHKPTRLTIWRFRDDISRELQLELIRLNISQKDNYACLGEVANIHHYLMVHIKTGRILPGIWHLEEFRPVTEEEL
jgi:hypothetical protein